MSQIKPDYVVTAIKRRPKDMTENTFMERFKYWQQHVLLLNEMLWFNLK